MAGRQLVAGVVAGTALLAGVGGCSPEAQEFWGSPHNSIDVGNTTNTNGEEVSQADILSQASGALALGSTCRLDQDDSVKVLVEEDNRTSLIVHATARNTSDTTEKTLWTDYRDNTPDEECPDEMIIRMDREDFAVARWIHDKTRSRQEGLGRHLARLIKKLGNKEAQVLENALPRVVESVQPNQWGEKIDHCSLGSGDEIQKLGEAYPALGEPNYAFWQVTKNAQSNPVGSDCQTGEYIITPSDEDMPDPIGWVKRTFKKITNLF